MGMEATHMEVATFLIGQRMPWLREGSSSDSDSEIPETKDLEDIYGVRAMLGVTTKP